MKNLFINILVLTSGLAFAQQAEITQYSSSEIKLIDQETNQQETVTSVNTDKKNKKNRKVKARKEENNSQFYYQNQYNYYNKNNGAYEENIPRYTPPTSPLNNPTMGRGVDGSSSNNDPRAGTPRNQY